MERSSIKIINAALDDQDGDVILRGVVDPTSLVQLKIADYQREVLPAGTINKLAAALRKGGVPDIQLGCRGGNWTERESAFYIHDDVYIIDGLQRRTAALVLIDKGVMPRLGATICFNTTEAIERERFRVLNVTRVKLSPNVLLRNARHDHPAISCLYQLSQSSQFVMRRRISWGQGMRREELLTASTLAKCTATLHQRFQTGLVGSQNVGALLGSLDRLFAGYSRNVFMRNVREFWDALDDAFHISNIAYKELATAMRGTFLLALADVFAQHEDFWEQGELRVGIDLRRKLGMFPIGDPNVAAMCGSSTGKKFLAAMIVDHLNSGKRTRRLRPFEEHIVISGKTDISERLKKADLAQLSTASTG